MVLTQAENPAERLSDVNVSIVKTPRPEGPVRALCKTAALGAYKHLGLMRAYEAARHLVAEPYSTIFLFHRVTDQIPPDGLTVSTSWFAEFCKLMKSNYHVVPLDEVVEGLNAGRSASRRTVAITFDDSYANNFDAARVLHDHGLPATFFVPTQFIGTSLRFLWDVHLPELPNLTWDQIRQMVAWGHAIGSHSVSHPDFGQISEAEAMKELVDSRLAIERETGRPVRYFAYPFGGRLNARPEQTQLVERAGYAACFSSQRGFVERGMKGQILPREAVPYFRNLTHLEVHINRCLDWFYAMKRWTKMIS